LANLARCQEFGWWTKRLREVGASQKMLHQGYRQPAELHRGGVRIRILHFVVLLLEPIGCYCRVINVLCKFVVGIKIRFGSSSGIKQCASCITNVGGALQSVCYETKKKGIEEDDTESHDNPWIVKRIGAETQLDLTAFILAELHLLLTDLREVTLLNPRFVHGLQCGLTAGIDMTTDRHEAHLTEQILLW
jgi:hypothetical protein